MCIATLIHMNLQVHVYRSMAIIMSIRIVLMSRKRPNSFHSSLIGAFERPMPHAIRIYSTPYTSLIASFSLFCGIPQNQTGLVLNERSHYNDCCSIFHSDNSLCIFEYQWLWWCFVQSITAGSWDNRADYQCLDWSNHRHVMQQLHSETHKLSMITTTPGCRGSMYDVICCLGGFRGSLACCLI